MHVTLIANRNIHSCNNMFGKTILIRATTINVYENKMNRNRAATQCTITLVSIILIRTCIQQVQWIQNYKLMRMLR